MISSIKSVVNLVWSSECTANVTISATRTGVKIILFRLSKLPLCSTFLAGSVGLLLVDDQSYPRPTEYLCSAAFSRFHGISWKLQLQCQTDSWHPHYSLLPAVGNLEVKAPGWMAVGRAYRDSLASLLLHVLPT